LSASFATKGGGAIRNLGEKLLANPVTLGILIVAEVRFLREALAEIVGRDPAISISGLSANLDEALVVTRDRQPDVVLLDAAFPDGIDVVGLFRNVVPRVQVIVFAVSETEENIIAWAEAGVAGYLPSTAALCDLVPLLQKVMQGEQSCSGRVAASLLHRIASIKRSGRIQAEVLLAPTLTTRELQICRLVAEGLCNKDIARRLNIQLATTKSHVHNTLGKLGLQRRSQVAPWLRGYEGHR
jgi:DNA-binding NarL/FixJ family response regulator